MNSVPIKKQRGRPPLFDKEQALDRALQVFWARGYEGASMAELTEALGINRPSIYAAFGNKEALFRKALDRYLAGPVSYVAEAMRQPTAKSSVEMFLRKSAELLTAPGNPRGCMIVLGALACGEDAQPIRSELAARRQSYENSLRLRLEQAKAQYELPAHVDAGALAKYYVTLQQGMSVQAAGGADREALLAVVKQAMQNWPV